MTLTFGSLFAGIGGFDLGFERAGMVCKWQVEIDPYCQRVLEKHWPNVRRHDDVRTFPPDESDDWAVDVICGGFPCQDISDAGKRAGLDGERSGLWWEYHRIIKTLKPKYAVIENVAALRSRGLDAVLGSLVEIGFDAEWHCVPASALGAPHRRDRLWIIAYANVGGCGARVAEVCRRESDAAGLREDVADAGSTRLEVRQEQSARQERQAVERSGATLPDPYGESPLGLAVARSQCRQWIAEPEVGRVANGVPARVDRLRAIGNAVVPQVAEWIGRRLTAPAADG